MDRIRNEEIFRTSDPYESGSSDFFRRRAFGSGGGIEIGRGPNHFSSSGSMMEFGISCTRVLALGVIPNSCW